MFVQVGVELAARTGRNPQYTYLQIGCSRGQEQNMLSFAKSCVGKPFSNSAMARSLIWPRKTDNSSFFCAELVAAILKHGGLIDRTSNPGSATPEGLHELYKNRAATTANPYLLRQSECQRNLTTKSVVTQKYYVPPMLRTANRTPHQLQNLQQQQQQPRQQTVRYASHDMLLKSQTSLKVLNAGTHSKSALVSLPEGFTLNTLDFRQR